MFKAFLNDSLFFDASVSMDELALSSAKLSLEAGKAGAFTFTLHPSNVMYDQFHKFTSYVDVYKKDRLIFSGRVLEEKKGFQNQQEIICEGLLAVFNDTVIRPFTHSGTLEALLAAFLSGHNSQVAADKRVSLGNITVTDSNNYVCRTYENYETTMKRLEDLAASLGGYFVVRKTDSGLVLDYLKDFTEYSGQTINFGENLLDLTRESTGADMITALIPLGAIDDETQEKLTIAEANDGLDYLVNQVALDEYGWILGVQEWSDVTSVTNLKNKGLAYLADKSKSRITINVSAVDMAKANSDISGFLCGQYIKVKSSLHGINEYLLAVKQDLDLLQPANNKMTLGTTRLGFIGQSNQNSANVIANVKQQAEAAAAKKTVKLETEIKQNAEAIQSVASQITTIGEQVTVAESMATQTAEKFSWIVKSGTSETDFTLTDRVATLMAQEFNISGLTTFMNAAMDGSATVINGGAIETATVTAEKLKIDGTVQINASGQDVSYIDITYGDYKVSMAASGLFYTDGEWSCWHDVGFHVNHKISESETQVIGGIAFDENNVMIISSTGGIELSNQLKSNEILPLYGSAFNLGSAEYNWVGVYASNFYQAGTDIRYVYATISDLNDVNTLASTANSNASSALSIAGNAQNIASAAMDTANSKYGYNDNIRANYLYISALGSASVNALYCSTTSGIVGTPSSSQRYKNSIADVTEELLLPDRLYDLPVRQFKWNEGQFDESEHYDYDTINVGFIAEEVAEHYPFAAVMKNDQVETWEARGIIPPMLALIQQQKKLIDDLTKRVERIEAQ